MRLTAEDAESAMQMRFTTETQRAQRILRGQCKDNLPQRTQRETERDYSDENPPKSRLRVWGESSYYWIMW